VGKATPGVELRIVDAENHPLPPDTPGEVVVRSPAAMRGYWRDPEATATTIDAEGWVHTGDVGTLDAAGYLRLRGRRSEMYIRGGFNIYPAEIEDLLARHPKVARVAVVGLPDALGGEGWYIDLPVSGGECRALLGLELPTEFVPLLTSRWVSVPPDAPCAQVGEWELDAEGAAWLEREFGAAREEAGKSVATSGARFLGAEPLGGPERTG